MIQYFRIRVRCSEGLGGPRAEDGERDASGREGCQGAGGVALGNGDDGTSGFPDFPIIDLFLPTGSRFSFSIRLAIFIFNSRSRSRLKTIPENSRIDFYLRIDQRFRD